MEPIQAIAVAAVTALTPYLVEAGKGFAKKAGETAWAKAQAVYEAIRAKFKGHPAAEQALKDLEDNPADEDSQAAVRKELKKAMQADTEFLNQLRGLVGEVNQTTIAVTGSGAVASGGVAAGAGGIAVGGDVEGGIHVGGESVASASSDK